MSLVYIHKKNKLLMLNYLQQYDYLKAHQYLRYVINHPFKARCTSDFNSTSFVTMKKRCRVIILTNHRGNRNTTRLTTLK